MASPSPVLPVLAASREPSRGRTARTRAAQLRRDARAVVDARSARARRPAAARPTVDRGARRACACARWPAGWPAPGAAATRRRSPSTGSSGRSSCQRWSGPGGVGVADARRRPGGSGRPRPRSSGRPASSRASSSRSSTSVGHPLGLRRDPARARARSSADSGAAAGQLGVAADRGQRGAQLVAGVGDELAQPHLAVLAGLQRGADVVEHLVERGADLADLGARVGVAAPARPARPRRGPAAAR